MVHSAPPQSQKLPLLGYWRDGACPAQLSTGLVAVDCAEGGTLQLAFPAASSGRLCRGSIP